MSLQITQVVPSLPTPPTRADATTFDSRADTFLSALPAFGSALNTWAGQANDIADLIDTYVDGQLSAMSKALYVDSISGLDTNPGTQGAPLATLGAALTRAVDGVVLTVLLARDGAYTFTQHLANGVLIIIFGNWVPAYRTPGAGVATVTQGSYWNVGDNADRAGGVSGTDVSLCLFSVAWITATHTAPGRAWSEYYEGALGHVWGKGMLLLISGSVEIKEASFARVNGNSELRLRGVTVTRPSGSDPLIRLAGTLRLIASSLTLPSGTLGDWITGIVRDTNAVPVPRNLVCNVVV